MAKFAEGTSVTMENSRAEIEKLLVRFGADQFGYKWEETSAAIVFRAQNRYIRFTLPLPTDAELKHSKAKDAKAREVRRRWRALALCIKAKLESVATGIETFEESFMPHIILPNGQTVAEGLLPNIQNAYKTGRMPLLSVDKR